MLAKLCPRCKKIISATEKHCKECQQIIEQDDGRYDDRHKARARAAYDLGRDPKYKGFYNSKAWKDLARRYLSRAGYLCEDCKDAEIMTVADEVHHMEPLTTAMGWMRRLDEGNLRALCHVCHNGRHDRFGGRGRSKSMKNVEKYRAPEGISAKIP